VTAVLKVMILLLQIPTVDRKLPFLFSLAMPIIPLIFMFYYGVLAQLVLQYPFLLITLSGVIFYTTAYLAGNIFFNSSTLINRAYFFGFMTVYIAVMAGLFMYCVPLLKLNEDRIIFRPETNCNMFENPPRYICYIEDREVLYTTTQRGCHETATNATSFYIISTWAPSKHQYRLLNKFYFYPENNTAAGLKPPYWLPKNYCIQEHIPSLSTVDKLRVSFVSWNTTTLEMTSDTGYIDRSVLEEYHTGWYRVSNCMWEVMRFLPFDCITGYVSNHYVDLPASTARLLHDKEALAKHV
jgi:hypothetical protein